MDQKKRNILVFPAGTEIAMEIHSALKYSKFLTLFGGTSIACHAEFVFENCIEGFPFIHQQSFIDYLNRMIDQYSIDYIYPAHDDVLMKLTEEQKNIHAQVVASPVETVRTCRSKIQTFQFLSGESYLPRIYNEIDEIDNYPVFIKPSIGQGAQGARMVLSSEQLRTALAEGKEYVICEYLPGEEYTVDCFTDRQGILRATILRKRERIRAGIAVRTQILPTDSDIQKIAENINTRLVFYGAWFFQVKKNKAGEYRLLEIAPRIAGTMSASRNLGINFPLLTLYNLWGYDVELLCNHSKMTVDSAFIRRFMTNVSYENVYVDFDDTLVLDGKVNTQLMMFLYQALNAGKNIYLLTKHGSDIHNSLCKYKISENIFRDIIHIAREEEKAESISSRNSIFIDDSFSERKKISQQCGIPVFDLDMVESLLDWRK